MLTDNCIYEPETPKIYNYAGLDKLEYNFDNILKSGVRIENVYICGYKINDKYLYPFLEFMLKRDYNKNILSFPSLKSEGSSLNIISKVKSLMYLIYNDVELDDKYEYKGSFYNKNNIYLFIDFTDCKLNINNSINNYNNINQRPTIFPALVDEIINITKVYNLNIDPIITDFLGYNSDFLLLNDENNNNYEIPVVVYVGREDDKLNFTYIFGVSKSDKNGILGSYFYFTDFKNSIEQCKHLINKKDIKENKEDKVGIVRFALFMGSTKVILNYPNDNIDESIIKTEKISDKYEKLTMRITDYDGKWAENYDSTYIGHIELDNGEQMKDTPIYAAKKYEQHIPLSYHYIDNDLLEPVLT